jgi:hypothetical protein
LQLDFPVCFLHVSSLYFIFFIFILKKEIDFWGITQNWVMTSIERILSLLSSSAMVIFVPQLMKLGMLSLVFSSS